METEGYVIDWNQPLSETDRAHALQRNMHAEVAENDERFSDGAAPEPDRKVRIAELKGLIGQYEAEISVLEQQEAEADLARNASATGNIATGNVIRDQTGVDGKAPEGAVPVGNDYTESKWTVDALKAEISLRNADRARVDLAPLSLKGTKAELIERLQEDDAEIAASDEQAE